MDHLTIPHDKALHIIYGALAALLVLLIWPFTGLPFQARDAGLVAAILVGGGKELIDIAINRAKGYQVHEPSPADAAVTVAGGAAIWAAAGGVPALLAIAG